MLLTVDLERLRVRSGERLLDAGCGEGRHCFGALERGAGIVAPLYRGQRGHPVGFSARYADELLGLSGDTGARDIIAAHGDSLQLIEVADRGVITDIDHPEELR